MTIQAGQWVKCVDAASLWGPLPTLVLDGCYLVKEVHDAGEHIRIGDSMQWLTITRFVPLATGLSTDVPAPKPKAPAIVLNAKAKGKAKPETQWVPHVTNHGALPEGSVVYTHAEYIDMAPLFAWSPLWKTIKSKMPYKYHDYVYRALIQAYGSAETMCLRPTAIRVVDAFSWSSTPQGGMWQKLSIAIESGNWTKFNDYFESQSETEGT